MRNTHWLSLVSTSTLSTVFPWPSLNTSDYFEKYVMKYLSRVILVWRKYYRIQRLIKYWWNKMLHRTFNIKTSSCYSELSLRTKATQYWTVLMSSPKTARHLQKTLLSLCQICQKSLKFHLLYHDTDFLHIIHHHCPICVVSQQTCWDCTSSIHHNSLN